MRDREQSPARLVAETWQGKKTHQMELSAKEHTVKHVSIRFLIGLSSPSDRPPGGTLPLSAIEAYKNEQKRMRKAERYLGWVYTCGGSYKGTGYWNNDKEPCMFFETVQQDSIHVRRIAREHAQQLAITLEQDAIGLVFTPVDFELVRRV
jgi:hypothetical protein